MSVIYTEFAATAKHQKVDTSLRTNQAQQCYLPTGGFRHNISSFNNYSSIKDTLSKV
jgi:hypothetical protein